MITALAPHFPQAVHDEITKYALENNLSEKQELDLYSIVLVAQREMAEKFRPDKFEDANQFSIA